MEARLPSWREWWVAEDMAFSSWEDRLLDMQPQMLYRYDTTLHVSVPCCMSQYHAPCYMVQPLNEVSCCTLSNA